MATCPTCGAATPECLPDVGSTVDWFKCRVCHKIWADHARVMACPKCGKPAARVTGRSENPGLVHTRCSACGHTSAREK